MPLQMNLNRDFDQFILQINSFSFIVQFNSKTSYFGEIVIIQMIRLDKRRNSPTSQKKMLLLCSEPANRLALGVVGMACSHLSITVRCSMPPCDAAPATCPKDVTSSLYVSQGEKSMCQPLAFFGHVILKSWLVGEDLEC